MGISANLRSFLTKAFYNQQAVIAALASPNKAAFFRAARQAARRRDTEALEPIIRRVFDRDSQVAEAARKALNEIDPHWSNTLSAARALLSLLLDADEQVRLSAKAQLDVTDPSWMQSSGAQQLLHSALQALHHESRDVKVAAIEVLAQIGGETYATDIIEALADQSHVVSEAARSALACLKWQPKTKAQAALYEKSLPYESVSIEGVATSRTFLVERKEHLYHSLTHAVFEVDFLATDRWEAIDKMLFAMYYRSSLRRDDFAQIKAALTRRESSMTTGIGSNVAIPHAASRGIPPMVGWFFCPQGIDWCALDNKPVHYIACYMCSPDEFRKNTRTLAEISRVLLRHEIQAKAPRCTNAEEWRCCVFDMMYNSP